MTFAPIRRFLSARPAIGHITRLTATATFAYLLALLIPAGTSRPVLAPLTALLVLQASLYQTIRSGIRKVASVAVGVLVAVTVAEFIGFSWWQLALVIAGALLIGRALRLGDDLLEVPISAMLIFSSAGTHAAATGRVVDTLVGTAAGLAGGLVFAAPRVQPAREAVDSLANRLADLLDRMAGDLTAPVPGDTADGATAGGAAGDERSAADGTDTSAARVTEWLAQARALRDEIERADDTLRQAADSVRLNPRSRLGHGRPVLRQPPGPDDLLVTEVALRGGLETLEVATVTVRGLARSVQDSAGLDSDRSPVRDEQTRTRLADVLGDLAAAVRTYGRLVQAYPAETEPLRSELAGQLADAHREQDELAAVLEPRITAGGSSSEWPLRGEILTHVDRLRSGLQPGIVPGPELTRPLPRPRVRRHGARPDGPRGRAARRDRQARRGGPRRSRPRRADQARRHDQEPRRRGHRVPRYWARERSSAQRAR
jgi:hypothetical protein